MVVISLKDYAAQNNISYEAVRQQVNRYKDELGSHIIRDGRQQFLDEEAVAFLDARRMKNPVAIIQQSKDEAIEALRAENERLRMKLEVVQDRVYELQQYKIEAEEKRHVLEDAKAAQERREKELVKREEQMLKELAEAAQKAAEDARTAEETKYTLKLEEMQQQAQGELTVAQKKAAAEQAEKEAWKKYAADLEEYNAKNWFQRRKAEKPVPPKLQEE